MDPVRLATRLFDSPSRTFAVELWDGLLLAPRSDAAVRGKIAFRSPRAIEALLPPASERRLVDAFLQGDIEFEGETIGLLEALARWEGPRPVPSLAASTIAARVRGALSGVSASSFRARQRGRAHSVRRDREAVRHHYDLSDDFYRLFLDREMVYSSGYFPTGSETLEEAQRAKLELVCRKLHLQRGERMLDVGCGWGALLVHAARDHGAGGLGITLSQNQLAEARRRFARLGAGVHLEALAADYRTVSPDLPFHKVASVGMMEHVGRKHLDEYFGAIHRLLRPGGLFLNHAIADVSGVHTVPWTSRKEGGFIDRYIFPDGDLVPVGMVVAAAERAGFEVRDLESLREHYAETLAAWLGRLEARFGEAEEMVGRERARAYRLYLASSAAAFRLGRISVFQLLLARRNQVGRAEGVPRSRAEWYRAAPAAVTPAEEAGRTGRSEKPR
jgi:cyclopropane-fatty-acyl-phospholipid synthase